MIYLVRTSTVFKLTTTSKFDTDAKYYYDSLTFVTPIKHNFSGTELCDKNTPTTQVQLKVDSRQCQQSNSTQKT